jgi:hypothetical protein
MERGSLTANKKVGGGLLTLRRHLLGWFAIRGLYGILRKLIKMKMKTIAKAVFILYVFAADALFFRVN